jgi:hypothetical protein
MCTLPSFTVFLLLLSNKRCTTDTLLALFSFGWKGDALQRAMDNRCFGDVCESLEVQAPEKAAECVKSRTVDEDIDGCKFFCLFLLRRAPPTMQGFYWELDDSSDAFFVGWV